MIGKIYKIIHNQSNINYVGSTFDILRNRFRKHKINLNTSISSYFEEFGAENFKIILIKEYEVFDKKHLLAYEQLWINKLKSINIMQTFKPLKKQFEQLRLSNFQKINDLELKDKNKEYYKKNKEILTVKFKEYYEVNKDKLQEKINCECGGKYTFQHKSRHEKSNKHLNFINQTIKIQKLPTDKLTCECGSVYSRAGKSFHIKSKKHVNYLTC